MPTAELSRDLDTIDLKKQVVDGEVFFKIENVDRMRPFFMSVVSHTDLWMFISSNGGVTAGRRHSDHAIFPYYTDDKVTESSEITGSKTLIRIDDGATSHLWEPMSQYSSGRYHTSRHLYKTPAGNKVRFEETNHDLQLTFWYEWSFSEKYGFVRKASIVNHNTTAVGLTVIDGLQNILPSAVGADLQNRASNLVDAYKRSELVGSVGLGIYALSAIIVDKAEPSEALKANTAWSLGWDQPTYLLSARQLEAFRQGDGVVQETDVKAEKGAYFVKGHISVDPGDARLWYTVADVNQDHASVISLIKSLENEEALLADLISDIHLGTETLVRLVAESDGLQLTKDKKRDARHFSNTLFNIMRGGIFDLNFLLSKEDFLEYLQKANNKVSEKAETLFSRLEEEFSLFTLREILNRSDDPDLLRLSIEYLPLKFSRRHGDPSRPWNRFTINIKDEEDGTKVLDYEGNWRDIFQNWEALVHAYPHFIQGMIFKFLNASTFDGYNPYRVTKDGFDWETIEPDDPWSYIGYWGDHQIIYLQKFLEFCEDTFPGQLAEYFDKDLFVYANVPYRIKAYEDLLKNPKDTIDFDHQKDEVIRDLREKLGADGALLTDEDGDIYRVNFIEKLLVTTLAKLSNFIPEGGIWMNTQRPEWNDANNALVGNGVSVVTLGYLRRMFAFLNELFEGTELEGVRVSNEVVDLYKRVRQAFEEREAWLDGPISDQQRREILDEVGEAASEYRLHVYDKGMWGRKRTISMDGLRRFVKVALRFLEHTLAANKREDDMYHAYNLMSIGKNGGVEISYLSEMLEGQVSALSSGMLSPEDALALLDGLKASALFRDDQYSYLLYPNKDLPGFLSRNNIPADQVASSILLQDLLEVGDTSIIKKDAKGGFHFNGNFKNANDLKVALQELKTADAAEDIAREHALILDIFEEVFDHKAFTGRSGTFFGYEGLGSIYWHMVSKLLLAVQESCLQAIKKEASDEVIGRLLEHYYEINEGIGVHKPPSLYGAFPTDPYSHTPMGKGAQQPGMTGQVKEDILSRFGELGVFIESGHLKFDPCLLRKGEFLEIPSKFDYYDVNFDAQQLHVDEGSLCFTFCQVPVTYLLAEEDKLTVVYKDGSEGVKEGLILSLEDSDKIFRRSGEIVRIVAEVDRSKLK